MNATLICDNNTCANCGADVGKQYCASCGQKGGTVRLDLWTLMQTGFRALLEFDNKIWRTIVGLTKNPGQVALDYISGARVAFVNPIKYLFAMMTIGLAITVLTGEIDSTVEMATREQATATDTSVPTEQAELINRYVDAQADILREYIDLVSFLTIPLFALFLRLQNLRQGKNYAEILTFVSYIWGHASLLTIPITLYMYLTGEVNLWAKTLVLLVILYAGNMVFFKRHWFRNIFSLMASSFFFFFGTLIVSIVMTGLRLLGFI
jgi:hypothetical protein